MAKIHKDGVVEFSSGKILMDDAALTGAEVLELVMLVPTMFPAVGMAGFPMRGGGGGGFGGGGGGASGPGTPGAAGATGFSGYSGVSGFEGAPGGTSGFSGFSGVSGFSGTSGFSGVSGFSGIGSSGFSGIGSSGFSGYSGAGTLLGPAYVFTSPSVLTLTDNSLIPWIIGRGTPVNRIRASVKDPPTGDDIDVDIKRYTLTTGVVVDTIGTVTIVAGDFYGDTVLGGPVTILETQGLAAEITSIGTVNPGEDLSIMVD